MVSVQNEVFESNLEADKAILCPLLMRVNYTKHVKVTRLHFNWLRHCTVSLAQVLSLCYRHLNVHYTPRFT
jgi:hypothetical protein